MELVNTLKNLSAVNFVTILGGISLFLGAASYILMLLLGPFLESRVKGWLSHNQSKRNLSGLMFYHRYAIILGIVAGLRYHWMQWHIWGSDLLKMEQEVPKSLVNLACLTLFLLFFSFSTLVLSGVALDILDPSSFEGFFLGLPFRYIGLGALLSLYVYLFFRRRKWKRIIELEKKGNFS